VRITGNPYFEATETIAAPLPGNEISRIYLPGPGNPPAGSYSFRIDLDPDNNLGELNESNNAYAYTLIVAPKGKTTSVPLSQIPATNVTVTPAPTVIMPDFAVMRVDTGKVIVFWTTPAYVDYVWTVRGGLDSALVERIAKAFLKLDYKNPEHKKLLDLHRTKGYIPAKDSDWKGIEEAAISAGLLRTN